MGYYYSVALNTAATGEAGYKYLLISGESVPISSPIVKEEIS